MPNYWWLLLALLLCVINGAWAEMRTIRIATFNVSMGAGNYVDGSAELSPRILQQHLLGGVHPQIRNVAAIIQAVRPDVLLLNEFDYIPDQSRGIGLFIANYLKVATGGFRVIDYPYVFVAPVNTGIDSGYDLNGDGKRGTADDAWGFGHYPGQYGMALLSRFPLDEAAIRTFRQFPWQNIPGALVPRHRDSGEPWYPPHVWKEMPLSSKSHWDVPVLVDGVRLHVLASHPTPPVFDGEEDRNGKRNHDEIRFWKDYTAGEGYFKDDGGKRGGLAAGRRFVILGDLNASPDEGDAHPRALRQLLHAPQINGGFTPTSEGGRERRPDNPFSGTHTADWGLRVDYVLPSAFGLKVIDGGVFWPARSSPSHALVASRRQSSDHRLVWLDLELTE